MSTKRALVKQKVTYGSVGDDNLHDSDEDYSGKQTSTKRVSFGSHELSDSDSDAENSLGSINRTSSGRAGDYLDGLFRETNTQEIESSKVLVTGTSQESVPSKERGEPKPAARPRPTISPRRAQFEGHSAASLTAAQSFNEDSDYLSSVREPVGQNKGKEKLPVAPPRTSPREHQGENSLSNVTSPRAVARGRPALSKREGEVKLFEKDLGVDKYEFAKNADEDVKYEYKRIKNVEEKKKTTEDDELEDAEFNDRMLIYGHEKTERDSLEKQDASSRRIKGSEDAVDKGEDDEVYESERTNGLSEKPKAPSRSKKITDGLHEKEDNDEVITTKSVQERPMAPSRRKKEIDAEYQGQRENRGAASEYERTRSLSEIPVAPSRKKKTFEETQKNQSDEDGRTYKYEQARGFSDEPMTPLRRKNIVDETHESRTYDFVGYKYQESHDFVEKPMVPLRMKNTLEEQRSRPQVPIIRYEDDGPFFDNDRSDLEQYGNLRHGQRGKSKGPTVMSVMKSDLSEESEDEYDSAKVLYSRDSFGSQQYRSEKRGGDMGDRDSTEKSLGEAPKPSPRGRATVDEILKAHSKTVQPEEEGKPSKRPGSAPAVKKASSLESLSSMKVSSSKKGPLESNEDGPQRVQLKKSLTPQRPSSGKKGSLLAQLRQKAQADVTATFEEHVPSVENVVGTAREDRAFRNKGASDTGVGGPRGGPKSHRSGPLRANQGIETMTRSRHPTREEHWADTRAGTPHRGSMTPKRSSSMTNLRETSPDPWSGNTSGRGSQQSGLMDTASIRQAVFDEWRSRKSVKLKEEAHRKSDEKKKQEEKELKERERKKMAKRAFESWNEMKQEEYKEANAKKKEMTEKELKKQTEKNLRARDAAKYFQSWKAKKDEELKEQHQKKKEEKREKTRKEKEDSQEKKKFSQKAFENWKGNKDEKIKEEMKKKRKVEKESTMELEDEKYKRSIECAERYQEWVDKKGKPRKEPPPPTLTQRSWCPSGRRSGNVIPERIGDVIQKPAPNRSRTMSGSFYLK